MGKIDQMRKITAFLLLGFSVTLLAWAQNHDQQTIVYFFYEEGCPYSRKMSEFLATRIVPHYPVRIEKLEIHQPNNLQLMMKMAHSRQAQEVIKNGVPAVFIGEFAFQGANRRTERLIEETIRKIRQRSVPPLNPPFSPQAQIAPSFSYFLIFSSGLISAFNPCSLGVIVLFLGTIISLAGFHKTRILSSGLVFSLTYFGGSLLVGMGLPQSFQEVKIRQTLTVIISVLITGGGLYYLGQGLLQKKSSDLPAGWRALFRRFLNIPGAIIGGSLAVFFLFPCSSGPYLAILALLSQPGGKIKALTGIIVYNLAFILPFVIFTLIIGLGILSWEQIAAWKENNVFKFKILLGLLFVGLGIWLFLTFGPW